MTLKNRARGIMVPLLSATALVGTVTTAHAGLVINPIWDSTINNNINAAIIKGTIQSALNVYQSSFTDNITVNINFATMSGGLGQSSTYYTTVSYSTYLSKLNADKTSADDLTALAHLPGGTTNPVNGNASINLSTANARAIGITSNPPSGQPDSFVRLNTGIMNLTRDNIDPSKYDLFAVVSHEIDEALGIGSSLSGLANGAAAPTGAVWGMDLYRYNQNGARSFDTNSNTTAYFSLDGAINLARFNQSANGDFADWYSTGAHTPQVQDAFATPGAKPNLGVELRVLDVLGYNRSSSGVPEPATLLLLTLGVCGGSRLRRRK